MIESIVTNHSPRAAICSIGPTLDFRFADQFRTQLEQLLNQGFKYFVLELSRTGILDSAGLGAIFALHKRVGALGGRVVVAMPSRPVQSVMALVRCDRLFGNYPSVQAAVQGLLEPIHAQAEPEMEADDLVTPVADPTLVADSTPESPFPGPSSGDGSPAPGPDAPAGNPVRDAGSYRVTSYTAPAAEITREPSPAIPAPARPQPLPTPERDGPSPLDQLLHLARAYGFIHSFSVTGPHVYLCLLEDSPAMELEPVSAEQFLKDLIGDLPALDLL